MNLDVKDFAAASKLFDNCKVMSGPAQLNSVGIIGHTAKWQREVVTELNCAQSVSLPVDLLARQNSHLSLDRLLLPISITGS